MTARGGLGRGLGALIPTGRTLEELPIGVIVPNSRQPRRNFDEEGILGLAASIRQGGVLQPVVVRRASGGAYELVMGERRWRAAREAGLVTMPALVVETDERGSLEQALIENMHRRDLNAIEEAAAYQQLIEEAGVTHEELATRLGLSRPAVTNTLRLLELPPGVQRLVMQGRISAGHGRALLGLAGHPSIERLAFRVAAEGLSVRKTEELVRRRRALMDPPGAPGNGRPWATTGTAGLAELAERLSDELQTRVQVSMGRGKGSIVIECGSAEDLERVGQRIIAGPTGLADGAE